MYKIAISLQLWPTLYHPFFFVIDDNMMINAFFHVVSYKYLVILLNVSKVYIMGARALYLSFKKARKLKFGMYVSHAI